MSNKLLTLGFAGLTILYLLQVDYSAITILNVISFTLIAVWIIIFVACILTKGKK